MAEVDEIKGVAQLTVRWNRELAAYFGRRPLITPDLGMVSPMVPASATCICRLGG